MKKLSRLYLQRFNHKAIFCSAILTILVLNSFSALAQSVKPGADTLLTRKAAPDQQKTERHLRKRLMRLADSVQRQKLVALPDSVLPVRFTAKSKTALKLQLQSLNDPRSDSLNAVNHTVKPPLTTKSKLTADSLAKIKLEKSSANLRARVMKMADPAQQMTIANLPDSTLVKNFAGKNKVAMQRQLQNLGFGQFDALKRSVDAGQLTQGLKNNTAAFSAQSMEGKATGLYTNTQHSVMDNLPDSNITDPAKALTSQAKQAKSKVNDQFQRAFGTVKKDNSAVKLVLSDELLYKPSPLSGLPLGTIGPSTARFANVVGINGNIQAFGLPMNVGFSSAQMPNNGLNSLNGLGPQLFKFDLDPDQYKSVIKNQIQHYNDLKKNVFGGLDLNNYTSKQLTSQLAAQKSSLAGSANLSKYLQDPAVAGRLLMMDQQTATNTIFEHLKQEAEANRNELKGLGNLSDSLNVNRLKAQALTDLQARQQALNKLTGDKLLAAYVNDPYHKKEFSVLTEQQIFEKLMALSKQPGVPDNTLNKSTAPFEQKAIRHLAHQITLQGKETDYNYAELMNGQTLAVKKDSAQLINDPTNALLKQFTNGKTQPSEAEVAAMKSKATQAAAMLADLKKQLSTHGYSVSSLMQMQQLSNTGKGTANLSEAQSLFFQKSPNGLMQQMFSTFSAFKVGSFGSNIPGSTGNEQMFMSGARFTFKSNDIPITLGYGGQNDIKSLKDDGYQNTVYTTPRNVGFLSADINGNRWGGPVKISVLGSYDQQQSNSLYSLPTISSNNVAFTIAKSMNMGKLGSAVMDISKTTTIYPNNYIAGTETILDRRAGVVTDPFYQSLSFGLTHHLDVQSAGLTDDAYFNYAGMGYQNPGNNGTSGAEMKFGGKVKKSFDNNRLILDLRSDFRNQPISYTSDDQWQTLQVQADARYKLSNKVNMTLQYSDEATNKKEGDESTSAYGMQKLQIDGSASYKIGKDYTNSHFTLGGESISNGYLAQAGGKLIMLNYSQVLVMGDRTLTANLFVNKEISTYKLIGNMINSDVTYNFQTGKSLRLISGLTYLFNSGLAQQTGVKEGFQYSAGDFDIASTIDLRKNLMTPLYPDLYSATQAEFSISYHFNH